MEEVKIVEERSLKLIYKTDKLIEKLCFYARASNKNAIDSMRADGNLVNMRDGQDETAAFKLGQKGDRNAIWTLLDCGGRINEAARGAAQAGHKAVVSILKYYGASSDAIHMGEVESINPPDEMKFTDDNTGRRDAVEYLAERARLLAKGGHTDSALEIYNRPGIKHTIISCLHNEQYHDDNGFLYCVINGLLQRGDLKRALDLIAADISSLGTAKVAYYMTKNGYPALAKQCFGERVNVYITMGFAAVGETEKVMKEVRERHNPSLLKPIWWQPHLDCPDIRTGQNWYNSNAIREFVKEACRFGHINLAMEFIKIGFRLDSNSGYTQDYVQIELYNELKPYLAMPDQALWGWLIKRKDASIIIEYILKNPHNFTGNGLNIEYTWYNLLGDFKRYERFESEYMAKSEPAFKFLAQREIYVLKLFSSIYDPHSLTQSWLAPGKSFKVSTPKVRQQALQKINYTYIHEYWLEKILKYMSLESDDVYKDKLTERLRIIQNLMIAGLSFYKAYKIHLGVTALHDFAAYLAEGSDDGNQLPEALETTAITNTIAQYMVDLEFSDPYKNEESDPGELLNHTEISVIIKAHEKPKEKLVESMCEQLETFLGSNSRAYNLSFVSMFYSIPTDQDRAKDLQKKCNAYLVDKSAKNFQQFAETVLTVFQKSSKGEGSLSRYIFTALTGNKNILDNDHFREITPVFVEQLEGLQQEAPSQSVIKAIVDKGEEISTLNNRVNMVAI